MEDNKLIAEFMGMTPHEQDGGCMIQMTHQGNEVVLVSSLKYHTSWDWLMPVVRQVLTSIDIDRSYARIHYDDDELKFNVLDCDISGVHKEVVEFIKTYNNE